MVQLQVVSWKLPGRTAKVTKNHRVDGVRPRFELDIWGVPRTGATAAVNSVVLVVTCAGSRGYLMAGRLYDICQVLKAREAHHTHTHTHTLYRKREMKDQHLTVSTVPPDRPPGVLILRTPMVCTVDTCKYAD